MKKLAILLVLLAILIPAGMWWFSPEQVLMRRTKHLMDVMTISEGTGRPLRQAKVFSMNALLAPEVSLSSPEIPDANGTFDKQEIESAFSWVCGNAKYSEVRVTDFGEITVEGDRAEVEATIEALLELPGTRRVDGSYALTIAWVKAEDGWRFEKIVAKEQ